MGRTRVVNIRKETCDVYIGRAGCGKDGYFGNPFRLEATMAKGQYAWPIQEILLSSRVRIKSSASWIGNLQGKDLGCFCKPDPCHGDIIKEYLDRMAENANEAIVIGQIHWKGCVYPVREIDAGNHIFRVSVESLRNELANDMRNGIYEAMEASEEIDGYCTDEELCTLSDTDLYKMYC